MGMKWYEHVKPFVDMKLCIEVGVSMSLLLLPDFFREFRAD